MAGQNMNRQSGRRQRKVPNAQPRKNTRNRRTQTAATTRKKTPSSNKNKKQVNQNHRNTNRINQRMVILLTIACVAVMSSAIYYLKSKAEVTTLIEAVALKESELSKWKEENNTMENELSSSVDLNAIKREAMDRLGMKYPSEQQNDTYETSSGSFLRQYQDVPDK